MATRWVQTTTGQWIAIDDATGQPVPTPPPGATAYMGDADPFAQGATAADIKAQQLKGAEEAGIAGAAGAAADLGKLGLSFINTPQDTYNTQRLKTLNDLESSGQLGLSGGERQVAEGTLLNPVRALATENRQRAEAQLAGMGRNSAADLVRVRQANEEATNKAALQAGEQIEQLNLQAADKQRQEAEERRAYESSRQRERIQLGMDTITGLAKTAGPVLSSLATPTAPGLSQLRASQAATNPDGTPKYPGLQGLSDDQLVNGWKANMNPYQMGG